MASLMTLVQQHGFGIRVAVPNSRIYMPFTILQEANDDCFLVEGDDGQTFWVLRDYPTCRDYEICPTS